MTDENLDILHKTADGYSRNSEEYITLSNAGMALIFVPGENEKAYLMEYIINTSKPLKALDLIYVKQCRFETPEKFRNEEN